MEKEAPSLDIISNPSSTIESFPLPLSRPTGHSSVSQGGTSIQIHPRCRIMGSRAVGPWPWSFLTPCSSILSHLNCDVLVELYCREQPRPGSKCHSRKTDTEPDNLRSHPHEGDLQAGCEAV